MRGKDWVERNNLDEKLYDPYFIHTGTFSFTVPSDATVKTFHVIIEATDNGKTALTRYAHIIVDVR